MKYISFVLLFLLTSAVVFAQKAGFSAIANTSNLQQVLKDNAAASSTISSDFSQVKNMKMLNDKVSSKGKFYFKKQDKVRIEYTSPFQYLLTMNGGMIAVKEGGKVSKINTRNSLAMQAVNRVMMDCMRGTVFTNKDFSVKAYGSSTQYLLVMTPLTASVKGLFKTIDVFIEKKDSQVSQLVMTESGGDYTDMKFVNRKINTPLADALFSIR